MDNNNPETRFEKFPGSTGEVSAERLQEAKQWKQAMSSGVPEFAGDQFGTANKTNDFYGETVSKSTEAEVSEPGEEYNQAIADAAALINYGLNEVARVYGVEATVQKIKGFDVSGSTDPIGDFFKYMGIDTPAEHQEVQTESAATVTSENAFREGANKPSQQKSVEGAFAAINDMKELISEVEGADPRYQELRDGARTAGKGVFEYAVSAFGTRDLITLFQVLATQREKVEETDNTEEKNKVEEVEDTKEIYNTEDSNNTEKTENFTSPEESNKFDEANRPDPATSETLNPEILKKNAA